MAADCPVCKRISKTKVKRKKIKTRERRTFPPGRLNFDCGKCLEELVTVRPLMEENEGSPITIPQGYDSSKIKVVGKIKGQPPYHGVLVHKGWKAHKRSLPKKIGDQTAEIICPAEVEVR